MAGPRPLAVRAGVVLVRVAWWYLGVVAEAGPVAGPRPLAVRAGVVLVRVASCRGPVRWAVMAVSSHSTASWSRGRTRSWRAVGAAVLVS